MPAFLIFDRLLLLATSMLLAGLTAAMTVVVLLGVFTRYVLNDALPWTEELARYILVWLSWLGGGIAMRRGSHIAVDLFIDKLSPSIRSVIVFLGRSLVLFFLTICVVYGLDLTRRVAMQSTVALGISMQIPYACVPIGAALMLYHLVVIMFVPLGSEQRDLQTEVS